MSARYGISAVSTEQFLSLPAKLPLSLKAVEFTGDVFGSTQALQKLISLNKNGTLLCGRDFIAPELAALIPEENCKLRSELELHFQERCAKAAEYGVKRFSVAFDLFQAAAKEEYREKLSRFLRRCAGVIHPFDQTMCLVCRVPGGGLFDGWEKILQFRRELLCPRIELLLELHPHEPNAPESINQALQTFRLNGFCRRICYDASVGNILTPGALKRCSETRSKGLDPDMLIFLNPGSSKYDSKSLGELDMLVKNFLPAEDKEPECR